QRLVPAAVGARGDVRHPLQRSVLPVLGDPRHGVRLVTHRSSPLGSIWSVANAASTASWAVGNAPPSFALIAAHVPHGSRSTPVSQRVAHPSGVTDAHHADSWRLTVTTAGIGSVAPTHVHGTSKLRAWSTVSRGVHGTSKLRAWSTVSRGAVTPRITTSLRRSEAGVVTIRGWGGTVSRAVIGAP